MHKKTLPTLFVISNLMVIFSASASNTTDALCATAGSQFYQRHAEQGVYFSFGIRDGVSTANEMFDNHNLYALVNQPLNVHKKNMSQTHVNYDPLDFSVSKKESLARSWWSAKSAGAVLELVAPHRTNRTYTHLSNTRGHEYIAAAIIPDYQNRQPPYTVECDVVRISTHLPPEISGSIGDGGSTITGNVDYSIDTLSKLGAQGRAGDLTWSLSRIVNPGQPEYLNHRFYSIKTSNGPLLFRPMYNGWYNVTATISDGTYERTINFANPVRYTGGLDNCPTCQPERH